MMKTDFPELEGKIITFIPNGEPVEVQGVVVGCNYDIGITIVNAEDKTDKLVCMNGSVSKYHIKNNYKRRFYSAIRMIETGFFDAAIHTQIGIDTFKLRWTFVPIQPCPYSGE